MKDVGKPVELPQHDGVRAGQTHLGEHFVSSIVAMNRRDSDGAKQGRELLDTLGASDRAAHLDRLLKNLQSTIDIERGRPRQPLEEQVFLTVFLAQIGIRLDLDQIAENAEQPLANLPQPLDRELVLKRHVLAHRKRRNIIERILIRASS